MFAINALYIPGSDKAAGASQSSRRHDQGEVILLLFSYRLSRHRLRPLAAPDLASPRDTHQVERLNIMGKKTTPEGAAVKGGFTGIAADCEV